MIKIPNRDKEREYIFKKAEKEICEEHHANCDFCNHQLIFRKKDVVND